MREAMSEELKGRHLGGEGHEVAVDGGYFGGYVKPANLRADSADIARITPAAVMISGPAKSLI